MIALHRAEMRGLPCHAMNSVDEFTEDWRVYKYVLGENKFTFVEQYANPQSVTILMKGLIKLTLLRAVKNTLEDGCVNQGEQKPMR